MDSNLRGWVILTTTLACLLLGMNMDSYVFLPRGTLRRWLTHTNERSRKICPPRPSPLDSNDRPETDMMEFLGEEGIQIY
jgi:hypothetical protein